MKFRSPNKTPIRVTTLAGHIAIVGEKWRSLPMVLHRAALAAGCQADQEHLPNEVPKAKNSDKALATSNEVTQIKVAIKKMLEKNDAKGFTADGVPKVPNVSKVCGFTARKSDVLEAWRQLKEEAEADSPQFNNSDAGDE